MAGDDPVELTRMALGARGMAGSFNDAAEEFLAAWEEARAEGEERRRQTRHRTLHDPLAYAVLTMVQQVATEAVRLDNGVHQQWAVQLDATAALLAIIDRAREGKL